MIFNSNEFLIFFVVFSIANFLVRRNLSSRNILVLAASYIFYGWWDFRFLSLLMISSVVDFYLGQAMGRATSQASRRIILTFSLFINLAFLGYFKYYNFFYESLQMLLSSLGIQISAKMLLVTLPVGISFYTFQSMSYIVDIYRRQIEPTRNLLQYLAYVAFFPQLVAGPIERAQHLLPQFAKPLQISAVHVEQGLWLILWGMFKKVALADHFAPLAEIVYQHGTPLAVSVILGTSAFGFQIYCDFSGYTDIARGTAKLLGFELMLNFNLPYFATSLRDFWARWHISLSTWLKDYLYISLGGNRQTPHRTYLNLLITMLLGGLWHGAAANFLLWGLWHGMGLALCHWWRRNQFFAMPRLAGWLLTMLFVFYGWLLFRSNSLLQVLDFTFALSDWTLPLWWRQYLGNLALLASPLLLIQWWQHRSGNLLIPLSLPLLPRAILMGFLLLCVISLWETEASPFIYFQF